MKIDINNIFSIREANRNFSKIAKAVDKNIDVVILKNNRLRYIKKISFEKSCGYIPVSYNLAWCLLQKQGKV